MSCGRDPLPVMLGTPVRSISSVQVVNFLAEFGLGKLIAPETRLNMAHVFVRDPAVKDKKSSDTQ